MLISFCPHQSPAHVQLVLRLVGIWFAVSLVVAVLARPHTLGIDPQNVDTPWKMVLNLLLVEWGPFPAGMLAHLPGGRLLWRSPRRRTIAVCISAGAGSVRRLVAACSSSW